MGGGALGGMFNALVVPVLFQVPVEYPLLIIVACLLRPAIQSAPGRHLHAVAGDLLCTAAFAACIILVLTALPFAWPEGPTWVFRLGAGTMA